MPCCARYSIFLVDVGNDVMLGLGRPSHHVRPESGEVSIADISAFTPTERERRRFPGDTATPLTLRIINKAIQGGHEVVVLCRRNGLPYYTARKSNDSAAGLGAFERSLQQNFPKDVRSRISVSTVHKYKGAEKHTVVVIDALEKNYPMIHPNWVFSRLFGDTLEQVVSSERRLFYVALTRAEDNLVIVSEKGLETPFLAGIRQENELEELAVNMLPEVEFQSQFIYVCLHNLSGKPDDNVGTIPISDKIGSCNYDWLSSKNKQCWRKEFTAEGFDISLVQQELWAETADGVKVTIENEHGESINSFSIDKGNWQDLTKSE